MESILNLCINIQMISVTDTNGVIHPVRFRFRDKTGEIVTVNIKTVEKSDQGQNNFNINFLCTAIIDNILKRFELRYSISQHKWFLSKIQIMN